MANHVSLATTILFVIGLTSSSRADTLETTFNLNFEGASLGQIERLDDTHFRCHVRGQQDEHGRNRQASWYYFRMDHVANKDVSLTLTDFVGEYHDRPGACPMGPDIIPVFSYDRQAWQYFPAMDWDDQKKEVTLHFRAERDTLWIAHIPPYTPQDLRRLLEGLRDEPNVLIETIGKTVQGRDIPLVTVTDVRVPDSQKKIVWIQARQHAWEAGTSYVMEGALRFIASDSPEARSLRQKVLFKFTPMVDLDGCANGQVRFNANGYDVNQHWRRVDLRTPELLKLMPEIWYSKRAILACASGPRRIDLLVNLHNDETNEYLDTEATDEKTLRLMRRFDKLLAEKTSFDPSRPLTIQQLAPDDTNSLYGQAGIPVLLMEQKIATSRKLGRHLTTADRLEFGRQLVQVAAEAVLTD